MAVNVAAERCQHDWLPDERRVTLTGNRDAPDEELLDRDMLVEHLAYVRGDNAWQQRARLLQSLWREDHGWLPGSSSFGSGSDPVRGNSPALTTQARVMGWRLQESDARQWRNFLYPAAVTSVQHALAHLEPNALMREDRLLANLLSSQPLCFNLFGALWGDHALAARVLNRALPDLGLCTVEEIVFEHSPGRGDTRYSGDRSAFDVAVRFTGKHGPGLIGIEVKYHESPASSEDLGPTWASWCSEIAPEHRHEAGRGPLVQLARDHRLARSITLSGDYPGGAVWLLLYPRANHAMAIAADRYIDITPGAKDRFVFTLEDLVSVADETVDPTWVELFRARYLDLERISHLLVRGR